MNLALRKINSISRYFIWHFLSKKLELISIVEFPKSGGTWVTQLVSEYYEYENRRNKLPKLEKSVIHGHYLNNESFNNKICVLRDGRDIIVSYYHHLIIGHQYSKSSKIKKNREKLNFDDYSDVKANLPKFIEFLNTDYKKRLNRFSWSDFLITYYNESDVLFVKYEDLLVSTEDELIKILNYLGENEINQNKVRTVIDKYSFKNQTNRKPGEEDKKSFLRKGISGDWKNYFSHDAAKVFDFYHGETLIQFGYEKNNDWIKELI